MTTEDDRNQINRLRNAITLLEREVAAMTEQPVDLVWERRAREIVREEMEPLRSVLERMRENFANRTDVEAVISRMGRACKSETVARRVVQGWIARLDAACHAQDDWLVGLFKDAPRP